MSKQLNKKLLVIALSSLFVTPAFAAPGDAVPNTFTNGTPADADQVNANFTEVTSQISTLAQSGIEGPQGPAGPQGPIGPQGIQGETGATGTQGIQGDAGTTGLQGPQGAQGPTGDTGPAGADGADAAHTAYNYQDYGHIFTSKTFTVTATDIKNTGNTYDTELRTFARTSGQLVFTRDRTKNNLRQDYSRITFDTSGNELSLTKFELFDTATTPVLQETRDMSPGVTFRTTAMEVGKTFGSDSILTSSLSGTSAVVQTATLIATDVNITVNQTSYTNCIKVTRHRTSTKLGNRKRINTFCPTIGLVRSISIDTITKDSVITDLSLCDGSACTQNL